MTPTSVDPHTTRTITCPRGLGTRVARAATWSMVEARSRAPTGQVHTAVCGIEPAPTTRNHSTDLSAVRGSTNRAVSATARAPLAMRPHSRDSATPTELDEMAGFRTSQSSSRSSATRPPATSPPSAPHSPHCISRAAGRGDPSRMPPAPGFARAIRCTNLITGGTRGNKGQTFFPKERRLYRVV